ncbi:hypothetical protein, partial [Escherichia coli]|uniref:hypothetical protein n=1 Tax=Escherichia coli TaxID=562 RepID=UPI0005C5A39E
LTQSDQALATAGAFFISVMNQYIQLHPMVFLPATLKNKAKKCPLRRSQSGQTKHPQFHDMFEQCLFIELKKR